MKKSGLKRILSYMLTLATVLSVFASPVFSVNAYAGVDMSAPADTHKFASDISKRSVPEAEADASVEPHWYDPDSEYHADIDYADMKYEGVDHDEALKLAEDMREYAASGDEEGTIRTYDAIEKMGMHIDTQYQLAEIKREKNVFDDEYEAAASEMVDLSIEFSDATDSAIRDAMDSAVGDALRGHIGDEDIIDYFLNYHDMTEEEKKLESEFMDLKNEFDRIFTGETEVTIDGEKWTFDKLNSSNSLNYNEYVKIMSALYGERNRQFAEIYIKIIENKNAKAAYNGYDNYPDYAYENAYNRDYTTQDIRFVHDEVRKYVVDLHQELEKKDTYNFKLENMDLSGEERLKRVGPAIAKLDPELTIAWDYWVSHGLYDLDDSDNKLEKGFTTELKDYGSAFIFDKPYGNWNDLQTVIHEFGHLNNSYHVQYGYHDDGFNVDVAEIHSQGLELLMLEYAEEIYGESSADAARLNVISDMVESIIQACMIDEFEYWAFTCEEELTADKLNDKFYEIYKTYYPNEEDDPIVPYAWGEITHVFETPFYYIAYGTSALAALDIFAMSIEDRQAGVDCYMNVTTYGWDTGYRELIEDVSLPDIFDEGNIEDICVAVSTYVERSSDMTVPILITVAVFFGVIIVIVSIVFLVLYMNRTKKRRMEEQIIANRAGQIYGNEQYAGPRRMETGQMNGYGQSDSVTRYTGDDNTGGLR